MVLLIVASNESNHLCVPATLSKGAMTRRSGQLGPTITESGHTLYGYGVLAATGGQIRMAAHTLTTTDGTPC